MWEFLTEESDIITISQIENPFKNNLQAEINPTNPTKNEIIGTWLWP